MINIEEYRAIQKYEWPLPNDIYDLINNLDGDNIFRLVDEIDAGMESMETIAARYATRVKKEIENAN